MQINFEKILKNQKFWIQKVHLYEFDPQIVVNSKKYPLIGIQASKNLDKPYVSYKDKNEYKKVPLEEVKFVFVEGANKKRLKETLAFFHEGQYED